MFKTCQILVLAVGVDRQFEDAVIFIAEISQKFDGFLVLCLERIIKDNKRSEFHIFLKLIPRYMHELFFSMIDDLSISEVDIILLVGFEHEQSDLLPLLHQALSEGGVDVHAILVLAADVFREFLLPAQDIELCKDVFQLIFIEDSPGAETGLIF